MTDPMRLKQVLGNLTNNAFKFTREGYIHLGFEMSEKRVQLYVEDSGQGISQEHIEHIFDRFYRIDMHHAGSGIGLALVKAFVELHKGTISVESDEKQGTIFTVDLPIPAAGGWIHGWHPHNPGL